jgi:predicted DsbA family dithiol-disulfide isomerase
LKSEYDVSIRWHAFPLHPETPEEGVSLEQYFGGRLEELQSMADRMHKAAAIFGVPFKGTGMIYNSRLAQELTLWAESKEKGDEVHSAIFRAYFVDGKNISSIPVLQELASSIGLSSDEASEVLQTGAFKGAVDADWDLSREMRIRAVPTIIMNQGRLVGAQSYDAFEALMKSSGVQKRSSLKLPES